MSHFNWCFYPGLTPRICDADVGVSTKKYVNKLFLLHCCPNQKVYPLRGTPSIFYYFTTILYPQRGKFSAGELVL